MKKVARGLAMAPAGCSPSADPDDARQPLNADLHDGIWHVHGTLPAGAIGGVAEIYLCQSNGRVLKIIHGQ
jgi:hypothetical protein